MHDYYLSKPLLYILMVLVLMGLISCIFCFCCLPLWRERMNKMRIKPITEPTNMVNPMRIETEKIARMI